MTDNWSAVFKDAAGDTTFTAGGYINKYIMCMPLGCDILRQALVQMEEAELSRSAYGLDIVPLRDSWQKVTVNAPIFVVNDEIFDRSDVTDEKIDWAKKTAENNLASGPKPTIL